MLQQHTGKTVEHIYIYTHYMCVYKHMTETLSAYMLQNCATLTSSLYIYIRKTQQMYKSIYIYISMYILNNQTQTASFTVCIYMKFVHIYIHIHSYILRYAVPLNMYVCDDDCVHCTYISYSKLILPFAFALPWS